jgi:hypothetical protein
MAARISQARIQKIKESLLQLTPAEILEIDKMIHEHLETQAMMNLAESAFREWEDPEEDSCHGPGTDKRQSKRSRPSQTMMRQC